MSTNVSNEDILRAIHDIGGGLHREIAGFRQSLNTAAKSINEQKFEEAKLLARELEELSQHISHTKREIALMNAQAESGTLSSTTFELDAIVQQTEDATNNIMNAAEAIDDLAAGMNKDDLPAEERAEKAAAISAETIKIFEACNFQDITGQRIRKVVKMLTYIETRIDNMVRIWGERDIQALTDEVSSEVNPAQGSDESLLNGPQLPGGGVSQSDIDNLFR
ncbi:protein phosphatase CheZ [Lacibacterium aquatile]|uniref:Protein phosphatase CheZ n=1 Tax=Lacibacterium aquatile TaxID=1168082 RepID=A0ABW5DNV3_9PROT